MLDLKKTLVTNTEGHEVTAAPGDTGHYYPTKLDRVDYPYFQSVFHDLLEAVSSKRLEMSIADATDENGLAIRDTTVVINIDKVLPEGNEARLNFESFIYAQSVSISILQALFEEVVTDAIEAGDIVLPDGAVLNSAQVVDIRQELPDLDFKVMFSFTTPLETEEEVQAREDALLASVSASAEHSVEPAPETATPQTEA